MENATTNREQLAWVLGETGRQLMIPALAIQKRVKGQKREKRRQKWLNDKLDGLTDDTLLDRIIMGEDRPVEPDPRPAEKPVYNPRPRSIDGIIAPAL